MTKAGDLYLGLDISLTSPGFAVIEVKNRKPFLVALSHTKTEASKGSGKNKITFSDGVRLKQIGDHLSTFMEENGEFKAIFKEKGFSRFATETQKLYKTHGVIEYLLHERTIEEIPPSTLKKQLTGNGRASKQDVQDAVCKLLGVKRSAFENDDESDAAGVVLSMLIKKNIIDSE